APTPTSPTPTLTPTLTPPPTTTPPPPPACTASVSPSLADAKLAAAALARRSRSQNLGITGAGAGSALGLAESAEGRTCPPAEILFVVPDRTSSLLARANSLPLLSPPATPSRATALSAWPAMTFVIVPDPAE